MMEHSTWLRDILIFLTAAVVLLPIVQRLKSTSIIGFLVVGLIIGPYGFGLIQDSVSIHQLAELGVVFLLFNIGLELSLSRLKMLGKYVFGLGVLQVCFSAFVIDLLLWSAGVPIAMTLIIGGALALSSTAFVTELLLERNELMSQHGRVAFAILLLQDIAVVPMLMFQRLLNQTADDMTGAFVTAAISGVAAVVAIIVVGRFVLRPVFKLIAHTNNPDLFVATILLIVLGSGWIMQEGGLSMAMGAFLCGVLLAESEFRHQIEVDIRPFKGLLLGLFFSSVGMSLDLSIVVTRWHEVIILATMLIVLKTFILTLLTRLFLSSWTESTRVALLLSQGGEFGFVILGSAVTLGLMDQILAQLVMVIVGLSMAVTPLLAWIGTRISSLSSVPLAEIQEGPEVEANAVLIAGFGRVGQTVAKTLSEIGAPFIALDLDHARVEECRNEGIPVFFGNAAKSGVLERVTAHGIKAAVIALDNESHSNAAVRALRNAFPEVPIIARSKDLMHGRDLESAGANAVVPDILEASLRLGELTLEALGIPDDESRETLDQLRGNDYALLAKLIRASAPPSQ